MDERRIFAPKKHPKIAHLTDEQINQLVNDYYNGIKLNEIIKKYDLKTHSSNLIKLFPPVILKNQECPYCKTNLWKNLESKNLINYNYWHNKPFCATCGHIDSENCSCSNCIETIRIKRIDEQKRIDERKYKFYDVSKINPVNVNELSITERIYLGTFLRCGLSENKKYLSIYNFKDFPIAPSAEMLDRMIELLLNRRIIVIHPDSPIDAFISPENIPSSKINISRILFHVNIAGSQSNEIVQSLLQPSIDIITFKPELQIVSKTIALEECKVYLQFSLNYVDFPYTVEDKANIIFENLLNHFSPAQIFGLINRCLGYTTKEFQGGRLTRSVCGAYLMGAVQIQGERALARNWNLTHYRRPRELPESQLSKFIFTSVLGLDDNWFNSRVGL